MTKQRKYKEIIEKVEDWGDSSEFEGNIVKLIERLQERVYQWGDTVFLVYDYNYGEYSSGHFVVMNQRFETDKEYDTRMEKRRKVQEVKKDAAKRAEDREKKEYERLKAKYGNEEGEL